MKALYSTLGLLSLGLPALAQDLTIDGAQLTVSTGATLYVPGKVTNKTGSTLAVEGTVEVGGDFENTGTVTSTNGKVRFNGSGNQVLTPGTATLYQVEVDKANNSSLLVLSDLTISNELRLTNGLVNTRPGTTVYTVILPNGASLVGEGAGRYVKGNVRVVRTAVSGSTAVDFGNGLTLDPSGNALGQVTVTRTAGLQTADVSYGTNVSGSTKGIDRLWTVQAAQQPTTPVPVTLNWVSDDDNGLGSFNSARMWQRATTPGTSWQPLGNTTDAAARSITASTSLLGGAFTVSNLANPLPVELISFTAERREADALLRWATAQEKNNDRFEVESSVDGVEFRAIGRVAGHGSSTRRHDYAYTDVNIARYGVSLLYYRLRQVDTDGEEHFSPVRTVRVEGQGELVQVAPNPFRNEVKVLVSLATAGPVNLRVHDATGRVLLQQQASLPVGASSLTLDKAGSLPVGMYFLTVSTPQSKGVIKLVRE